MEELGIFRAIGLGPQQIPNKVFWEITGEALLVHLGKRLL
jgi:hypothetical protein